MMKLKSWFMSWFAHSRTILVARLYGLAALIVAANDYLAPFVLGQDWSPITAQLPPWLLPVGGLVTSAVFEWLRRITTTPLAVNIDQANAAAGT